MIKKIRILFILMTFFLGVNIVNADSKCEKLVAKGNYGQFVTSSNKILTYSPNLSRPADLHLYKFSIDGKTSIGYCRNAGISSNNTGSNNTRQNHSFKCINTLFDRTEKETTETDKAKFAYEKGIIKLLEEGQKSGGLNIGIEAYSEINIAQRIYEMYWHGFNSNEELSIQNNYYDTMKYYANLVLKDSEVVEKIDYLKQELGENYINSNPFTEAIAITKITRANGAAINKTTFENKVKEYTIKALDAAIDYLKNGAALINWNKTGKKSGPSIKTIDGKKYYTVSYIHKFDIENFETYNASIKLDLECSNCSRNGIEYKIYIKGKNETDFKEVSGNLSNIEILDYVENGNGNVEIKIDFKKIVDDKECNDNASYKLNVKYYDETIDTEAYNLIDEKCESQNKKCQYFYVLFAENVERPDSSEDQKIELCVENTTSCSSYIKNDTCESGKQNLNISINEGYEIDVTNDCKDESQEITSDKLNVLQCIANDKAKDDAGNSYKVTAGETYKNVTNNSYCSVYCMEDYHFTLPGMKDVKSGRYFTLEASVKGTKKCYTNEINKDKFEDDLEEARQDVVEAYNNWLLVYTAIKNRVNYSDTKNGAIHGGHYDYENCSDCPEEGECPPIEKRCPYCSGWGPADEYTNFKYTWSFDAFNPLINYETKLMSEINLTKEKNTECNYSNDKISCTYTSDGYTSCEHEYGSSGCDSKSGEDITKYYNSGTLEKRETKLNTAIQNYENVINEYNSCFGSNVTNYTGNTLLEQSNVGWKINYNYDPKISFWYKEIYMNSVLTNKLDVVGNGNKNFSTITEKKYSSSNGKIPTNEITNKFYEFRPQFICYKKDNSYVCDTIYISISNAKYVSQEMTVNASYITPTQFYAIYPSGAIVVTDGNTSINNSSALPNGLPIGLGTKQGVYNYVLKVENLGEYYNSDKLGRIWGDSKSVVVDVLNDVKENKSCSKEGALTIDGDVEKYGYDATYKNGVYVCGITVNLPVCDINDPNSEGYNSNWQKYGWKDACTPNESCNPNDPTSPGYNQNWKNQGWLNGCTKRNIVVNRKCNPNNPASKGYNKNWQADGWKDGCTPNDPCPNGKCPIVCDPVCKWETCPENNCTVECSSCVFTNNQTNISTRPITPSDINPNDRELGKNWQFDETNLETSLELKAYVTTTEIVTDGESIYENGASVNNDYTMEINLDSSLINKIREYSKQHEDTGGYATNTLKCYDYNGKDGNKYDNVFCYSTFIDELIYDGYEDNFSGIENRVIGRDATDSDNLRKEETQKSGYWTTWDEATWNITTTIGVNPQQNYKGLGIGPSWK